MALQAMPAVMLLLMILMMIFKNRIIMKKSIISGICILAMSIVSFSCQKEVDAPETNTHKVSFSVLETKTVISDESTGSFAWENGDMSSFHIFENGVAPSDIEGTLDAGVATVTAIYEGTSEPYTYTGFWAKTVSSNLPAVDANQINVDGVFDPASDILVAKPVENQTSSTIGSGLQLQFKRVVAVNKMTLKNLPANEQISQVVISSDKDFVGTYDYSNDTWTLSGKTITIDLMDNNMNPLTVAADGTFPVYFVCAPVENATLTVRALVGSDVYAKTFASTITFAENTITRFGVAMGTSCLTESDEWTYTFTGKVFDSNTSATLNGTTDLSWTLAGDGGYWSYDSTKGHQFGSSNKPYTTMTLTANLGNTSGISDVKINTSGASDIAATVSISVGGTPFEVSTDVTTASLTSTATDYKFSSPDGNMFAGDIVISYNQTSSKAIYIKTITVNPQETVATPTFTIAGGVYDSTQNVGIECTTTGATIYYTTDGTDPTTSSNVYSEAIDISETTTLKAIAVKDGMKNSAVASATYTIGSGSTSTLTFTAECEGSGTADDNVVWTVTSDAAESTYDGTKGIHYGTSKKAVSYLNLTTSGISGTITQIVVNASGASNTSAKLNVTVGGEAFGDDNDLTSSAENYVLTGSASGEIVVAITQSSAKKALYCKSITVTYTTKSN